MPKPENHIWQRMTLLEIEINGEWFFYTNVDPYCGVSLILLYYFIKEDHKRVFGLIMISMISLYLVLYLFFALIFQFFFSFAILSNS